MKNKIYDQQLRDVRDIKTQLGDQKNIEVKKVDKKTFDDAMKFLLTNANDEVASFLINSLHAIIQGNPEAKRQASSPEWKNIDVCQEAMRNADVRKMDKAWIREHMEKITGESGVPEADGQIYKLISDPANTKKYWPFVAFFKVLSKTLHLGMMLKKEDEMQKRVYTNDRSINQMQVKIKVSDSIANTTLYNAIENEANRIREQELKQLRNKRDHLLERKQRLEHSEPFAEYFQELFDDDH